MAVTIAAIVIAGIVDTDGDFVIARVDIAVDAFVVVAIVAGSSESANDSVSSAGIANVCGNVSMKLC